MMHLSRYVQKIYMFLGFELVWNVYCSFDL